MAETLNLAASPLEEAPVFFMKYVEGLSLEEIGQLYGVELDPVQRSFQAVCVDLAFRSGFTGNDQKPPDMESFSEGRPSTGVL